MSITPIVPVTPGTTTPEKTVTPATTITPTATPAPIKAEEELEEKGNPAKDKEEVATTEVKSEEKVKEVSEN